MLPVAIVIDVFDWFPDLGVTWLLFLHLKDSLKVQSHKSDRGGVPGPYICDCLLYFHEILWNLTQEKAI